MLKTVSQSQQGQRSANNEDASLVLASIGVFAIADGVGGGPAGDQASKLTLQTIGDYLNSNKTTRHDILSAIMAANSNVFTLAKDTNLQGMASTLSLAWIEANTLTCFNIGDSRVYHWRQQQLTQLTTDHVTQIEKQGRLKTYVTKAIGISNNPGTEVTQTDWQKGDILLLMTDGISDKLSNEELENIVHNQKCSMVDKASMMVEHASLHGSTDDKTVIIVF